MSGDDRGYTRVLALASSISYSYIKLVVNSNGVDDESKWEWLWEKPGIARRDACSSGVRGMILLLPVGVAVLLEDEMFRCFVFCAV